MDLNMYVTTCTTYGTDRKRKLGRGHNDAVPGP